MLLFLLFEGIVIGSAFVHISLIGPGRIIHQQSQHQHQHQHQHQSQYAHRYSHYISGSSISRSNNNILINGEISASQGLCMQHQNDLTVSPGGTTLSSPAHLTRRRLLRLMSSNIFKIGLIGSVTTAIGNPDLVAAKKTLPPSPSPLELKAMVKNAAETFKTTDKDRVYQLTSGISLRNIRIGSGPPVSKQQTYDDPVVLHLRATILGGKILFDTKNDGSGPIFYTLGTCTQDFDTFGGDSSTRSRVTQGVEDAVLSRGLLASWNGGTWDGRQDTLEAGRQAMEPMREGGLRSALVPATLAYGNSGVSRYDAFKMGLKRPVPRGTAIMYEIELLRCSGGSVRACCTEDNYPCEITHQG